MTLLGDGAPVRTTGVNPAAAAAVKVGALEGLVQEAVLEHTGLAGLDRVGGMANFQVWVDW